MSRTREIEPTAIVVLIPPGFGRGAVVGIGALQHALTDGLL